MQYVQNSSAPSWFDSDDSKIYVSATSGSSPFNEYYEFEDRADALNLIAKTFSSQSFIDRFEWCDGEIYDCEWVGYDDEEGFPFLLSGEANPADLSEIVEAESRF
jgi:hypothetical protein